MAITKERIISLCVLLAVAGGFYGVWHFYLSEQWATYNQNQEFRDALEGKLKSLKGTFDGALPTVVVDAWAEQTEPWQTALEERTPRFNVGDWLAHDTYDESGPMLRFWYDEVTKKMVRDFYKDLPTKMNWQAFFIGDFYQEFGVATNEAFVARTVKVDQVYDEIKKLQFGISASRHILDVKPASVMEIRPWTPRHVSTHRDILKVRTVGYVFQATLANLITFLETQRTAERYYTVEALECTYPYLAYEQDPVLSVRMIVSQATYDEPKEGVTSLPAVGASGPIVTEAAAAALVKPKPRRRGRGSSRSRRNRE
jgi:hypothetical protein